MKIRLIISLCLIFVTCTAVAGWGKPELVYIENNSERQVDGIDGNKPYYVNSGDKKNFTGEGEFFLKVDGDDILEYGYSPVNYMVEKDTEGFLDVFVSISENKKGGAGTVFGLIHFSSSGT